MSTPSEKANLARIRDNQRRSRARRKEYLQELEARLRQCELQGIETSAEIQMAARKVADENKKLRLLLAQRGVGVESVEAFLQTAPVAASVTTQHSSDSGAVQVLEQMLQLPKPCCVSRNTPIGGGSCSRESSSSNTTATSMWDPVFQPELEGANFPGNAQHTGTLRTHQYVAPSASISSQTINDSLGHSTIHPIKRHQRFPSAHNGQLDPTPNTHIRSQSMSAYDPQLAPPNQSYHLPQGNVREDLQPLVASQASGYFPDNASINLNNCTYATDMISTMAGCDPMDVRADLGCVPGLECEVNNQLVFDVMDRYSGVRL